MNLTVDLRRHIVWLAPAASIAVVAVTVSLSLWIDRSGTQAAGFAPVAHSDIHAPQGCGDCHPQEFRQWATSTHASASFDPLFQMYLQDARQPGECFACHATGYSMATGQFLSAGVSCEACHGAYSPGHPAETMVLAQSPTLCGQCHPSTLVEWRASDHGLHGVTCIDCHEVHTQRTRAASATSELCFSCHAQEIAGDIHGDHQPAEIPCVACHLARPSGHGDDAVNGQAVTAHSFTAVSATCADCHPDASSPQ